MAILAFPFDFQEKANYDLICEMGVTRILSVKLDGK